MNFVQKQLLKLSATFLFSQETRKDCNAVQPKTGESCLRGGNTPYSGLYGEAPPKKGALFNLAVYKRVGKIAILAYERATESAT